MLLRKLVPFALALAPLVALPSISQADPVTLKFGTLAPPESPWGKVFKVWARADRATARNGSVQIQFFWNGQQGDEAANGRQDPHGAARRRGHHGDGLGQIYKQTLVFQLPGLFRELGEARRRAHRACVPPWTPSSRSRASRSWAGATSASRALHVARASRSRRLRDLKHKATFYRPGDPIAPMLFSVLGDVTPKADVGSPRCCRQLTANTINVRRRAAARGRAAPVGGAPRPHQHARRRTSRSARSSCRRRASRRCPPTPRAVILDTGRVAGEALTTSIRARGRRGPRAAQAAHDGLRAHGGRRRPVDQALRRHARARFAARCSTPPSFDEAVKYAN